MHCNDAWNVVIGRKTALSVARRLPPLGQCAACADCSTILFRLPIENLEHE